MKNKVLIGFTYGDPSGIGSEILCKTLKRYKFKYIAPVLIGSSNYFKQIQKKLKILNQSQCQCFKSFNNKYIDKVNYKLGAPDKSSGLHSYHCLKYAVELANRGDINAIVTGPVSKEIINSAGIKFSGQTDLIADFCKINKNDLIMLFVSKDFRLALFTRHIPLKEVSSKINKKDLKKYLLILIKELKKWFLIKNPKICVLGLNPHAGEKGLFGGEEKNIIIPVIKELRKSGYLVYGPSSPDATLAQAGRDYLISKKQKYDAYVSFYHDQGLLFFKALSGKDGINITLGLPYLRVSVDHGTAFDIAGKNKAEPESLIYASRFLDELFGRR